MKPDLVMLVADKDMEHALRGLLERTQALQIRPIKAEVFVHPQHDPACARQGVAYLSSFAAQFRYGLLLFDHEGSGREDTERRALQREINGRFERSAWGKRARTVVIAPELEAWIWNASPHVADVAGWKGRDPSLRDWLVAQGWWQKEQAKPERPKEAFLAALQEGRTARSASLYRQMAERVSLRRCRDESFLELKRILQTWFPAKA